MVRRKSPEEFEDMADQGLRDPMPLNLRRVQIVNLLAINVNLEAVTEMSFIRQLDAPCHDAYRGTGRRQQADTLRAGFITPQSLMASIHISR
jgi:hypothetical protein